MENLIFFLASSFAMRLATPRKFKNQFIGNTGCSVLAYGHEDFDSVQTSSGDRLYFNEFTERKVTYGMICVELKEAYQLDAAAEMMVSYIDKLREPLFIEHRVGISPAPDWNNEFSATVTDYWQDMDQMDWKVKGYTDGRLLAILYVRNIGQLDVHKQDMFLDSFHFKPSC